MANKKNSITYSSIKEYNLTRYPKDVMDNPTAPYVYFMSLSASDIGQEILSAVASSFSVNTIGKQIGGQANIDAAFTFLDGIIQSEYSKEQNFLQYLKNKTKGIKNFNPPRLDGDWANFVKEIQEQLGGGEKGLQSMQNELKRLQHQNERRGNKQSLSKYDQDQIEKLAAYSEKLINFVKNRKNQSENLIANKIQSLVLSKFGEKIISLKEDGNVELSKSEFLAMTNAISTIVLHDYIIKNSLDETGVYRQFDTAFNEEKFLESLNSSELNTRVNNFLKRVQVLPFITEDISETLGYQKNIMDENVTKKEKQELIQLIHSVDQNASKLTQIGQYFQNMYNNYVIPESAIKFTQTGNALAEVVSALNSAMRGASGIFNTGSTGAKPDNILGFLTIDIDALLDLKNSGRISEYNKAVGEIYKIHGELKKLSHEMDSVNTQKYYKRQENNWDSAEKAIQKSLDELKSIFHTLENCYIIEDSTKNYISLYGNTVKGKLSDSMHGGSLGPNVLDQINKIADLASLGGITFPQAKWLITVIINSGPGMIAQASKESLESYLAAFATILLFDDQINIVKQTFPNISKKLPSSSVTKIHLFSVNDGYYPLSFVLQMTKEALIKRYQEAQAFLSNSPSGGAKVEISGYVKAPVEAYKNKAAENQWYTTRDAALGETKLSITFLVGFLDVLSKLFPSLQ